MSHALPVCAVPGNWAVQYHPPACWHRNATTNPLLLLPPSASADPGPLNRAEWIKFVATFFNLEATATALFAGIEAAYEGIKAVAATSSAWHVVPVRLDLTV